MIGSQCFVHYSCNWFWHAGCCVSPILNATLMKPQLGYLQISEKISSKSTLQFLLKVVHFSLLTVLMSKRIMMNSQLLFIDGKTFDIHTSEWLFLPLSWVQNAFMQMKLRLRTTVASVIHDLKSYTTSCLYNPFLIVCTTHYNNGDENFEMLIVLKIVFSNTYDSVRLSAYNDYLFATVLYVPGPSFLKFKNLKAFLKV